MSTLHTWKIPFNDLRPVIADQRAAIDEAIKRVLDSGVFIQGPEVKAFEQELAAYCGVKYCVSCANGTDAIILSLLSIGPFKTRVATVANSAPATVSAVYKSSNFPDYTEILPNGLIDVRKLPMCDDLKAILLVNLYGQISDAWLAYTKNVPRCPIIEDGAQSLGSTRFCKTDADIWTTSFYPTKNLGGLGDGGAVLTNDIDIANKIRCLANYGLNSSKFIDDIYGFNSRLDEIQAAILRVRLKDLDLYCDVRRSLARLYDTILDDSVKHRPYNPDENYHLYTIFVPDNRRLDLQEYLAVRGIQTTVHYNQSVHHNLPITKIFQEQVLSLPLWPGMEQIDAITVAAHVNDFIYKNNLNVKNPLS